LLGRAGHAESIARHVLAVTNLQGGRREWPVTNLQAGGDCRAVTDSQESCGKICDLSIY
jgi:hypothetical protein